MVKETIKKFYNLVDPTSREELQAALEAIEIGVAAEVKETFGDATLADGETKIYFPGDELTVGTPLFQDEEMLIPAPAGEWALENGDVLTTDEAGLVVDLAPAGEEDAPEDEAPVAEEPLAAPSPASVKETTTTETVFNEETAEEVVVELTAVEEILLAIQPIFEDFTTRLEALEGTGKENEELKETLSKTQEKVEMLGKTAAAQPYTGKPATAKRQSNMTMFEKAQAKGNFKLRK